MRKNLQHFVLLLLAGVLFAGCSDKEEGATKYKTPEGLYIITRDTYYGNHLNHSRKDPVDLIFYGDPSTILLLLDADITIFPMSKSEVYFGKLTKNGYESISTRPINEIYRYSLDLSDCINNNSFKVSLNPLTVTENGNYDFYFQIKNPQKKIYFQTPNYQLILNQVEGKSTDWFTTQIKTLN